MRHGEGLKLRVLGYVTIEKFAAESGYTPDAVRSKIKTGVWLEGQVWVKAPDGRNLIKVEGYIAWVEKQLPPAASAKPLPARSKSTSSTGASAAANG